jgi:hypothetical protein
MRPVLREGSEMAGRIAAGRLDLDHVGAEVGQQPPGQRALEIGQIEDAQPVKSTRAGQR